MGRPHYLFVTGRLAEQPLRRILASMEPRADFRSSVAVMPITIAALITPRWLARRLQAPSDVTKIIVPGHCLGDLKIVEEAAGVPVERGPRDLLLLPEFFGQTADRSQYGDWDIEILAEMPGAAGMTIDAIVDRSRQLDEDGADVVVLHGAMDRNWPGLIEAVREIRSEGRRVAVANAPAGDMEQAAGEGAELIFLPTECPVERAADWRCELVVSCGGSADLDRLADSVDFLQRSKFPFRIDPGLRPIGLGLAESLAAFVAARRRWPDAEFTMNLGTVTETGGVDSAGLNVLLLGICQELGVRSVVTREEAHWCRTAVRECHLGRQLVRYSTANKLLPRGIEPGLLLLRDGTVVEHAPGELDHLASILKDGSPRIFAEGGRLHAVMAGSHLESDDPYDLFEQVLAESDRRVDAVQAFYLGYEMAKAVTALSLGKTYRQEEPLDWGMLTRRELTRLERRALRLSRERGGDCPEAAPYFEDDDSDAGLRESGA